MSENSAEGPSIERHRDQRPVVRLDDIGTLIRQKRRAERLTLEMAGRQCGVSPATLSRLERRASGGMSDREMSTPDVRTLGAVTEWLGVAVSGAGFAPAMPHTARKISEDVSVPSVVEAHLRADRNLDPATAALLARMFRAAYSEFSENSRGKSDRLEHEDRVDETSVEGE